MSVSLSLPRLSDGTGRCVAAAAERTPGPRTKISGRGGAVLGPSNTRTLAIFPVLTVSCERDYVMTPLSTHAG